MVSDLDAAGQNAEIIARRYPIWNLKASLVFAGSDCNCHSIPGLDGIGWNRDAEPAITWLFQWAREHHARPQGDAEPVLQSTNAP